MHESWAVFNIQASSKNSHRGWSTINKLVTRGNTVNIHKCTYGVGFKKHAPWALQEIGKFAEKERGTPKVCINTRLNRALSRKRGEDPPNKFYTLATYMPVTTFKNLWLLWMRTNC
ncbi:hypothetical protein FD755_017975 [Muntiacus reevesi]|uniref:Uncharacterized protein n=1 Tax=Muntiacus reevesi TaxID=9886 RepID=A0A5N3X7B3_MUNRE|nr:hypothetical protein FD755_017975 [Muntiacus reevesi]